MEPEEVHSDRPVSADDADRLRQLHEATRDLMVAETKDAVADVASRTARGVLGLDINAVFFREREVPCTSKASGEAVSEVPRTSKASSAERSSADRSSGRSPREDGKTASAALVPVAATDAAHEVLGEIPSLRRGESMGWLVYERGEATVYDDVREAEVMQNPDTPMRSELLLPLGEHGLFIAGTTAPSAFSEGRVSLGRVFADTVEAALDRAEREERLACKNDQLDRFASVVSHDLRSPLTVAQGRLDLARETGDDEQFDHVRTALERIDALLEDLLTLARDGRRVGSTESVSLESVIRSARSDVPAPLAVTVERDGVVEADRGRLRELLSNLLANAADHGASSVRLGWLETRDGFYVADDGPGVDAAERDRLFEHGYTTTETGTGFGLAIVREIATAHGWTVTLGESAAGGLHVEVAVGAADF